MYNRQLLFFSLLYVFLATLHSERYPDLKRDVRWSGQGRNRQAPIGRVIPVVIVGLSIDKCSLYYQKVIN